MCGQVELAEPPASVDCVVFFVRFAQFMHTVNSIIYKAVKYTEFQRLRVNLRTLFLRNKRQKPSRNPLPLVISREERLSF